MLPNCSAFLEHGRSSGRTHWLSSTLCLMQEERRDALPWKLGWQVVCGTFWNVKKRQNLCANIGQKEWLGHQSPQQPLNRNAQKTGVPPAKPACVSRSVLLAKLMKYLKYSRTENKQTKKIKLATQVPLAEILIWFYWWIVPWIDTNDSLTETRKQRPQRRLHLTCDIICFIVVFSSLLLLHFSWLSNPVLCLWFSFCWRICSSFL